MKANLLISRDQYVTGRMRQIFLTILICVRTSCLAVGVSHPSGLARLLNFDSVLMMSFTLTLPRLKSWDSCFSHHCGLSENPWPAFVLHGVRRRFGLLPGVRVPHGAQIQKSLCRRGEHRQSLLFYVHSRVYIAVMMCTAYRACPFPDRQVLGFRIPVSADVAGLA